MPPPQCPESRLERLCACKRPAQVDRQPSHEILRCPDAEDDRRIYQLPQSLHIGWLVWRSTRVLALGQHETKQRINVLGLRKPVREVCMRHRHGGENTCGPEP